MGLRDSTGSVGGQKVGRRGTLERVEVEAECAVVMKSMVSESKLYYKAISNLLISMA